MRAETATGLAEAAEPLGTACGTGIAGALTIWLRNGATTARIVWFGVRSFPPCSKDGLHQVSDGDNAPPSQ